MTRTATYKAWYFGFVICGGIAVGLVLAHLHFAPIACALVVVALLLPGRVLGFFWRDLLRGLRLLNSGEYAESKRHSERFLAEVHRKPWLKQLIWLGSSAYSRDPEVLALNNLGAAEMHLGEFECAKAHLEEAIGIDRLCPLPHFNLRTYYMAKGDLDEAERCAQRAALLGYKRDLSDRVVIASQTRFARTDGAGRS